MWWQEQPLWDCLQGSIFVIVFVHVAQISSGTNSATALQSWSHTPIGCVLDLLSTARRDTTTLVQAI